ncbi:MULTISPECIES: hypothetical protein [Streptomyces]|uniref:hypothetical protein n=1 Tax=Streptomyces TaxID=1883 RepID=UPI000939805B|nr:MULTISPECIES: hypothetical protein [unclassified Streptomyces]OKJ08679.1 hypothetical protein AMK20_22465 [Streptomyces sp. TSRI0261]QNQ33242.1 hypothetical protein HYC88_05780 [Streptomyces sp. CB00271]
MQFTLDGEPFELTPTLGRGRLAGHLPVEIHEYRVEVDGARWPVQQVISLATGAKRSRFQPHDSRRWLQNLGFDESQLKAPGVYRHDFGRYVDGIRVLDIDAELGEDSG